MRTTRKRRPESPVRRRIALHVLLALSAIGAFGAGLSLMTHMHHLGLRHVVPSQMAAYDAPYEQLSDAAVIPTGVLGVGCSLALLALRPRGVPLWLIGINLALQLAVFVTRVGTWGTWAQDVRDAGSVFLADGSLHPSYVLYVETNWVRIAMIAGYALVSLVMAALAVSHPRQEPAPRAPARAA